MTNVEYYDSAYHIDISNLHSDNAKDVIAKFDTGASSTFFTIGALFDDITSKMIFNFDKKIRSRSDIISHTFNTASGTDIKCYKCYAEDIDIGNIHLDRFYYWINPSIEYKKSLLGDDFICNCTFTHNQQSDIVISAFNSTNYCKMNSKDFKNLLSENEILDIFSEC